MEKKEECNEPSRKKRKKQKLLVSTVTDTELLQAAYDLLVDVGGDLMYMWKWSNLLSYLHDHCEETRWLVIIDMINMILIFSYKLHLYYIYDIFQMFLVMFCLSLSVLVSVRPLSFASYGVQYQNKKRFTGNRGIVSIYQPTCETSC